MLTSAASHLNGVTLSLGQMEAERYFLNIVYIASKVLLICAN